MNKKGVILIMEPERIVGWELQLGLEGCGYSVFQSAAFKPSGNYKDKRDVKAVIVNIDKVNHCDFSDLKAHLLHDGLSVIALSSAVSPVSEYEGVQLAGTFIKPFDTKEIISLVEKHSMSNKD